MTSQNPDAHRLAPKATGRGIRESPLLAAEAQAKAHAAGITPLEYLCTIFRDEGQPLSVRIDAAKAAVPFMHPRLAAIEAKVDQFTQLQVLALKEGGAA